MNIEDVKQMSDRELNIKLSVLTGYTDTINKKLVERGLNPKEYENDIFLNYVEFESRAREAQVKAMTIDKVKYVKRLCETIITGESCERCDWYDYESGIDFLGIASLIQATPRQISEASYITLMEVQQGNE